MNCLLHSFLFFAVAFCLSSAAAGQEPPALSPETLPATDSSCPQMDIFDILTRKKIRAPEIPSRKVRAIILPLVALSPATGLQLGAGSSLSWTIGRKPDTRLSAGSVQALWTTERQFITYIRSNMFFPGNRWFLQTDWRWYLFRLPTYGLGTGPEENIPEVDAFPVTSGNVDYRGGRFTMKYNWVKFHNILFVSLARNFYAGAGLHYDHYYDIADEQLRLDSSVAIISPHYAYSVRHGFRTGEYSVAGISLNASYDSRDNIINPYRGYYINASYLYNFEFLGSDRNGSRLWVDFRTYVGVSKRVARHLLAFRLLGSIRTSGELPYLNLMATGFDPNNSSGRGSPEGRWRGENYICGEAEYRFPISPCSRIVGGVLFANVTSASNRDMGVPLLSHFRLGCGFGFRIMVGKHDRTNLLIDLGLGDLSHGIYLQAQEIF